MKGTQSNQSQASTSQGATASDPYASAAQNAQGQGQGNYAPPPQGAPVGGQRQVGGGIAALFARGGRVPNGRESNSRDLSELTKKFQEFYEEQKQTTLADLDIRIVPVAKNSIIGTQDNSSNAIGMILFIVGQGTRYAHHALLLASEMSATAPSRSNEMYGYNFNQEQINAPRTPATLADDALAKAIRSRVGQIVQQGEIFSADWSAVPTSFKMNDKVAVELLFLNALRACWTELQTKTPGFVYDSLSSVASDGILVNAVHFNVDQSNQATEIYDAAGNRIRAEIVTEFRSEQPRIQNSKEQTENTAGVMELGRTTAMVSLNIDPSPARANRYVGGMPQNTGNGNDTQEYSPEVTITGLDMALPPDLGNVLLQISTILAVLNAQERPWLRCYMPRHLQLNGGGGGYENFRPRDLGAVNYDYGLKTARPDNPSVMEVVPFPTTDKNQFQLENFYFLANSIMQQAPALSIDVPIADPQTWFLRVFAEASDVAEAYNAIVNAMDALTDNKFKQHFFAPESSRLIVLPRTERVLNGHFPDDNGHMHDAREVDLVYLLNAKGHEDPDIGKKWAATFGGSSDAQLAARAKLIESVVHNVTWTGISLHKTFHPDFLRAMDRAIGETGFKPKVDIAQQDNRMAMRQPYGLAAAGALATNFQPTMFTTGPTFNAPGGGYRTMSHNRVY